MRVGEFSFGRNFWRFGSAAIITAAAIALRVALIPLIGNEAPYITVLPVIVLVAWYVGLGPALFSVFVGGVASWFLIVPAEPANITPNMRSYGALLVYIGVGILSALIGNAVHKANRFAAKSASEYRTLFEAAGVANAEIDLKTGLFARVNQKYCDLLGYTANELEGKLGYRDVTHPDDCKDGDPIRSFVDGKIESLELDKRYIRKDGSTVLVHVVVSAIKDLSGKVVRILCSAADVTERHRAEEALRISEEFSRRITDVAPGILYIYDIAADRNIWSNRETVAALGYTKEELESFGSSLLAELMHPDDWHRYLEYRERVRATADDATTEFEYRMKRADGSWIWLHSREMPFRRDDSGKVVQVVGAARDITDWKTAEDALKESSERLQAALDGSRAGTFRWNIKTNQLDWDRNLDELFGLEPGVTVRSLDAFIKCIHPDDQQAVIDACERCASAGADFNVDFRVTWPDGRLRWLSDKGKTTLDKAGKPDYMTGMCLDITEKRAADAELAEQRRLYQSVTDNATTALFIMDDRQQCTFMNPAAEKLTGFTLAETLGRRLHNVIHHVHPDGSPFPPSDCPIDQAFPERNQVQGEEVFVHKDGHFYDVSFTASPMRDAHGTLVGTVIEVQDITARKKDEDALRSSEMRFRIASSAAGMFAWENDLPTRTIQWSENAAEMIGCRPGELPGTMERASFFADPEDAVRVDDAFQDILREKRENYILEFNGRRDLGSRCWETHGRIVYDENGNALRVYGITQDVTDRKRWERELTESRKELEATLVNLEHLVSERTRELEQAYADTVKLMREVSAVQETERKRIGQDVHDQLGQSVTALRLNIESLSREIDGNLEHRKRIDTLKDLTLRLDADVSYLAWMLRPTALDELGLLPAVDYFTQEWSRHYGTPAEFHSIGVSENEITPELETNIYRIVQESLTNCAKHAKASKVSVMMEQRDGTLRLIVEDDGVGFDPAAIDGYAASGTGLGLQGIRDRAALVGGDVEIESSPNSGTTIFLTVPVARDLKDRHVLTAP